MPTNRCLRRFRPLSTRALRALELRALNPADTSWAAFNYYLHSQVGRNALHIDSANGHLELVKYLLPKFGQKKFDLDDNRYTCLTLAIEEKELDVVDYLLQEGGLCIPQQQVSTITFVPCIMARPLPPLHFVW